MLQLKNMVKRKIVLLLSGAPGTGKTTVKRNVKHSLTQLFGKTAVLSTDDIFNIMDPHWESRDKEQMIISTNARKICSVITNKLFDLGYQFVLMEGNALFQRNWVEEILEELTPDCDVYHITLHATIDVVDNRVNKRGDGNKDRVWLSSWLAHIEKFFESWTYVIDTSTMTEEGMMDAIKVAINSKRGLLRERQS